jgi:hypothetical protein
MVLHQEPIGEAVPGVHGGTPCEEGELDMGPPTQEKARVGVLKTVLRDRVVKERLDGVHLFGIIYYHRVIPLAVWTTKMWEYTGITDPNQVSTVVVPNNEVWSWLDMVLKVGNQ